MFPVYVVESVTDGNWQSTIPEIIRRVDIEFREYFLPSIAILNTRIDTRKDQEYVFRLVIEPLLKLQQQVKTMGRLSSSYPAVFARNINDFYFKLFKKQVLSYILLYEREKMYLALAHILYRQFLDVAQNLTRIHASTLKLNPRTVLEEYKRSLTNVIVKSIEPVNSMLASDVKLGLGASKLKIDESVSSINKIQQDLEHQFGFKGGAEAPRVAIRVQGTTEFPPRENTDIRDVMFTSFKKEIETTLDTLDIKSAAFYNQCYTLYQDAYRAVTGIIAALLAKLVQLQDFITKKVNQAHKDLAAIKTAIDQTNAQFYKSVVIKDLNDVNTLVDDIKKIALPVFNDIDTVLDALKP